jgi:RimJ/RimL family protein N-acetyltransferase
MVKTMIQLRGPRLVLRDLGRDDLPAIHAYGSEPDVVRFQPWGPNTPEDSRAYLRAILEAADEDPRTDYTLGVELPGDPSLLGNAAVKVHNREHAQAELSYVLHPRAWGQGYATEAAQILAGFAFDQLSMHRLFSTVDPRNAASVRVLEKLGMTREGHLRDTMRIRDGWRDSLIYSILEPEWRAKSGSS